MAHDDISGMRYFLRRMKRAELYQMLHDYIGFRDNLPITLEQCEQLDEEDMRKYIFESDCPGHYWRRSNTTEIEK